MFKMIKKGLDALLEVLTATIMGILVLDVTWQVITRFILKNPSSWTEELAIYMVIWAGLLGSAVALNRRAHLGIDYFVGKLKLKYRLYTEIIVYLLVAGFSVSVLLIGGIRLVNLTFMKAQISPSMGFPIGYVYLALPIAGFFITLYSLEFLVQTIAALKKTAK